MNKELAREALQELEFVVAHLESERTGMRAQYGFNKPDGKHVLHQFSETSAVDHSIRSAREKLGRALMEAS